ncbi:MAG: efflux RND transporter permease subunit [Candidatus Omnitrophica bacterium]|nr:efflux RND transporter permease subunit [Candidatus Omnitrophota bacterium]
MSLPSLAVQRPVTITMVFIGIMLLGIISLGKLPQELFPALNYPQLSIVTNYENAAPEEVETLITKVIEEGVGTVSKVKRVSSTSREGTSLVVAEFGWGTNMDFAALAVREKIDLVKERLPNEASDPIVMKFNPFELPIMVLSITGERHPADLKEFVRKRIKDELEKVEGVASASLSGGVDREILIELDQARLQAHNVPISRINEAVGKSNLNYPAGTIEESFYEYLIRTMGEFKTVGDLKKMVVRVEELSRKTGEAEDERKSMLRGKKEESETTSRFIALGDLGDVKETYREKTSVSRYNGIENISLSVLKQAGANTISVSNAVQKRLEQLRIDLPQDVDIAIVYDQSAFIKKSINEVRDSALIGGVLVFLVLLFFLRDIKNSLIVATSIPISILATFSLMYFIGITINMMSLMGLALGIGMLVDNSIVVMENIFRLQEEGKGIVDAARDGANEMNNAVWASTLTTICVFAPMILYSIGVAGQLFKELAWTVIFSLSASVFVALSLIPRLVAGDAARTLGQKDGAPIAVEATQKKKEEKPHPFIKIEKMYADVIGSLLNKRFLILSSVSILFVVSMMLFTVINKEFMPKVDEGQFVIKVNMPTGTRLEVTDRVSQAIERLLSEYDPVESVTVNIGSSKSRDSGDVIETLGVHQAQIIVNLKGKRAISTNQLIQMVKAKTDKMALEGAEVEYVAQESLFASAFQGGSPIVVELKGKELDKLKRGAEEVQRGLLRIQGIYGVKTSLSLPHPEIKVNVIKDKASFYQLAVNEIALTTHIAVKGAIASKFKEGGKETDIRVRLQERDRKDLVQLRGLLVHSPLDLEVPLKEVAYITKDVGPSEIKRIDQQRVVFISANVTQRPLSQILEDVDVFLASFQEEWLAGERQGDYVVSLTGERQQMEESFGSLRFALIFAIVLVYMIMASLFESLWQPFVIMFTVPLSLIGIAWTLLLTGTPMSAVVLLGIIILGGIVVNNGIVLIDTINLLRLEGQTLFDAVREAAQSRLRPILMTTLTTVLGWIPMAVSGGLMAPMALTVMGGLIVSTFLTLVVIPVIFFGIASKKEDRECAAEYVRGGAGERMGVRAGDLAFQPAGTPGGMLSAVGQLSSFSEMIGLFLKGMRDILSPSDDDIEESLPRERPWFQRVTKKEDTIERQEETHQDEMVQQKEDIPSEPTRKGPADLSWLDRLDYPIARKKKRPREEKEEKVQEEPDTEKEEKGAFSPEPTEVSREIEEKETSQEIPFESFQEEREIEPVEEKGPEEERRKSPEEERLEDKKPEEGQAESPEEEKPEEKPHLERTEEEDRLPPIEGPQSSEKEQEEGIQREEGAVGEQPAEEKTEALEPPQPDIGQLPVPPPDFIIPGSEERLLNERQEKALEFLKVYKRLTRKQYSVIFKVSVPTAARDLKDLVDRNLVHGKGPLGPGRWYELAE